MNYPDVNDRARHLITYSPPGCIVLLLWFSLISGMRALSRKLISQLMVVRLQRGASSHKGRQRKIGWFARLRLSSAYIRVGAIKICVALFTDFDGRFIEMIDHEHYFAYPEQRRLFCIDEMRFVNCDPDFENVERESDWKLFVYRIQSCGGKVRWRIGSIGDTDCRHIQSNDKGTVRGT